jgi:hypothetical protein
MQSNQIPLWGTITIWIACAFFLLRGGDMTDLPFTWNNILGAFCLLVAFGLFIWQAIISLRCKNNDGDLYVGNIAKRVILDFTKMSPEQINAFMSGLKDMTAIQIDTILGEHNGKTTRK